MAGADEIEDWFARSGLGDWVEATESVARLCDRVEDAYTRGAAPGGVVPDSLRMEGGEVGVDPVAPGQSAKMLPRLYYVAPEGPNGVASDVYALGVILYRLLTAELPFPGTNPVEVALAHRKLEPPAPSRLRPGIPDGLEAAIFRAMAKRPEERFESPARFAAALRDALAGWSPAGETAGAAGRAVPIDEKARGPKAGRRPVSKLVLAAGLAAAIFFAWLVSLGVRPGPEPREMPGSVGEGNASPTPTVPAEAPPAAITPIVTARSEPSPAPADAAGARPVAVAASPVRTAAPPRPSPSRPALAALETPSPSPTPTSAPAPAVDPARLAGFLAEAEGLFRARSYLTPPGENAAAKYRLALEIDPANELARGRLDFIRRTYIDLSDARARDGDPAAARGHLEALAGVFPADPEIERRAADMAERARSAEAAGRLAIRVKPWGRVFVDGKLAGLTPLAALPLPAGRHRVEVQADGRKPWSSDIEIEAGRTKEVEVALEEETSARVKP